MMKANVAPSSPLVFDMETEVERAKAYAEAGLIDSALRSVRDSCDIGYRSVIF